MKWGGGDSARTHPSKGWRF